MEWLRSHFKKSVGQDAAVRYIFFGRALPSSDSINMVIPGKIPLDKLKKSIKKQEFPENKISTSKYNVLTFLPKNLWEQFT